MSDAAPPADLRRAVLDRIDDDEIVRLAGDLIRIPSFTTEAQSYAGNDTTHLWAAGIPCCLYGPGGGYTDYHDVHVDLDDLFLCTRVLALTALDATR
jgi:acetylornithine deacetylase